MTSFPRRAMACSIALMASALFLMAAAPTIGPIPGPDQAPVFDDSATITNPFAPFQPNATKVYRGRLGGKRLVVIEQFSDETRSFEYAGQTVECCILIEQEFLSGSQIDTSITFLGEDVDSNVYIFGEISSTHENGVVVSNEGSWLVGEAQEGDPEGTVLVQEPGLFMPANPQVGDVFNPDNVPGVEVETYTVLKTGATLRVALGRFSNAIKIREVDGLDGTAQLIWIVPGLGEVKSRGKKERLRLEATTLVAQDP